MAGTVEVNTGVMQATAHGAMNLADSMLTQARTLSAGLEFVHANWKGEAGDAFRAATLNQRTLLKQLIEKLHLVAETIKKGGQGFAGHEANARTAMNAQGQNFLRGSLNHS